MAKPKTETIQVRGPLGIVCTLTPKEFAEVFNGAFKTKVHRKKCTFLPGVGAKTNTGDATPTEPLGDLES